jgi:hypothetical protein
MLICTYGCHLNICNTCSKEEKKLKGLNCSDNNRKQNLTIVIGLSYNNIKKKTSWVTKRGQLSCSSG